MKRLFYILPLFLLLPLFYSCVSSETALSDNISYKEISASRLGRKVEYQFNSSGRYVIASKKEEETAQEPFPFTSFIIFRIEGSKIVFEERLRISGIKWISETEAEALFFQGAVSAENPDRKYGYIYNAVSGTRSGL